MFKDVKIKTFNLDDLVGRILNIRSYKDSGTKLISAIDTETGELFVLKEIILPKKADMAIQKG